MSKWKEEWDTSTTGRQLYKVQPSISKSNLDKYRNLSRIESTILFQMRTGKIGLNKFLHEVKIRDSPACQCGAHHQTTNHILLECPDWTDLRNKLLWQGGAGPRDTTVLLNDPTYSKRAARFMARTGLLGAGFTTREDIQSVGTHSEGL